MKTSITVPAIMLAASLLATQPAAAQPKTTPLPDVGKPSIGISGGHYRYDPGVAIEFTTRAIFQNHLSLRTKAIKQWLEDYQAIHHKSASYHTISVALVYNGVLLDRTRFYTEFGMIGIAPNSKFSDTKFVEGVYGLAGLEINLLQKEGYSISLSLAGGPAFIKAFAEKIEGNPRYGNGMHYINGLRIYIGK